MAKRRKKPSATGHSIHRKRKSHRGKSSKKRGLQRVMEKATNYKGGVMY